jgi:hypothetical protein
VLNGANLTQSAKGGSGRFDCGDISKEDCCATAEFESWLASNPKVPTYTFVQWLKRQACSLITLCRAWHIASKSINCTPGVDTSTFEQETLKMNSLLSDVLDAHGGLTAWRRFSGLSSTIVSGGSLWGTKGINMDATPRVATTEFRRQWTSVAPFGAPDWRMVFAPERVVIEKNTGEVVAERDNPRDAFAGHTWDTQWDPLHLAYFNGYAMWTYHAAPFVFTDPGFEVTAADAVLEDGQTLRGLGVRFPKHIHTHSTEQNFYFGEDGLLRRHDYHVDVAGGWGAAHLLSEYTEVEGLHLPTKRRVFKKAADGSVQRDKALVSVDLSNYRLF